MLDTKDFSFFENNNNFDFKGFLLKILSYWKWFIVSLIITFTIAYQINIRKEKIYGMESLIVIKDENNALFSSSTNLVFNWGGTSDKVQAVITTLKSRLHNEAVVQNLNFYIKYLKTGEYNLQDAYGEVPFYVVIDKTKPQLSGRLIKVRFINDTEYKITIMFDTESVGLTKYSDNSFSNTTVALQKFEKNYQIGEEVNLPFLHWKLELNENPGFYKDAEYFVQFDDFNGTVASYRGLGVDIDTKGASILRLTMQGANKARMVDYLNATVEILRKNQLDSKNQFANNTIRFIDSTIVAMGRQLAENEDELKSFRKDKNIFNLENGGEMINEKISAFDLEKEAIKRKMSYYNSLESYLNKSDDYSRLPAPSVAGIEDPNIVVNVAKLISFSTERSEMAYSVKNDKLFQEFDNQMEAVKRVLVENIKSAKVSLGGDLQQVNTRLNSAEANIRTLPEDQQDLLKITRKYDLNENIYKTFLEKRSQADIIKASNLSDIQFIDPAKDIGGGLIGPKTSVNYVMALFLGMLIPLLIAFTITILDNSIHTIEDIQALTQIPVLGIVGKKTTLNNLAVFEKPKSALAESFRAIRSSLQFMYKKQNIAGAKTLMITSSISGEGKTFCSINIATVFALSEKKTVIVGLDLRKPKIFEDFNIENTYGVVNFLIGQKTVDQIIQKTHISYLDVIPSGPVPPNPAELILGDSMKVLLDELKAKYDYIILDTPPVGLVSDALELAPYCDVTLYIVRQNVTKKGMLSIVNTKHKRGELHHISMVLNGFENKTKYGYGYGYGYGDYSAGYHEEEPKGFFGELKSKILKKK
ncbi:polysaccharide biosynthesis tyrosine autokinase [Flavobacterium kingsejongi]|uniref:non-specific protein-tyrosine kinase n=1 Tax=Flavobacterium kingsejongi TaxID=1678728 RepID=A0A2S1LNM0_9FLAO|nr:tyrosine-protein kinase domain-containing protein [Flavobacterium kingsejongi]AWG25355.1 sugar transporter [Flavobacterium kingsejongi]